MSYQKGLQAVFTAAVVLNIAYTVVGLGMRNVDLNVPVEIKDNEEEDESN